MDLIKKLLPKQKTIQTFKVDTLGFRITIKENPPAQIFSHHFLDTSPAGNWTRAFGDLLIRSLTLYQLLHWGERNSGQKFRYIKLKVIWMQVFCISYIAQWTISFILYKNHRCYNNSPNYFQTGNKLLYIRAFALIEPNWQHLNKN